MILQAPRPPWSSVSTTHLSWPRALASSDRARNAKRIHSRTTSLGDANQGDAPTDPIQARLAAAKAYKQKQTEEKKGEEPHQEKANGQPAGRTISSTSFADGQSSVDTQTFARAQSDLQEARATGFPEGTVEVTIERGFGVADTRSLQNKDTGSSASAASWLQTTSTQTEGISKNLRAEEFTAEKEKRIRGQEIVIERAKGVVEGTRRRATTMDEYGTAQMFQEAELSIAADRKAEEEESHMAEIAEMAALDLQDAEADQSSQGDAPGTERAHRPAVATWGVFPRPQNISKTYGGGRNIRPGQALESEEEKEARKQRVAAALAEYRKVAGLDIEPEVEDAAMELYEQGQALFEEGTLRAALEKYQLACELVPLKTKVGGLANFQKAVCLDSLGRNDEAYSIYKSLRGHSAPGVAKNSKRLMFGFKAAKDLKVDKMRAINAGSVDEWRGYFDRATDGTWAVYKRKEGEDEAEAAEEQRLVVLSLVVLVVLPIAAVALLAAR